MRPFTTPLRGRPHAWSRLVYDHLRRSRPPPRAPFPPRLAPARTSRPSAARRTMSAAPGARAIRARWSSPLRGRARRPRSRRRTSPGARGFTAAWKKAHGGASLRVNATRRTAASPRGSELASRANASAVARHMRPRGLALSGGRPPRRSPSPQRPPRAGRSAPPLSSPWQPLAAAHAATKRHAPQATLAFASSATSAACAPTAPPIELVARTGTGTNALARRSA